MSLITTESQRHREDLVSSKWEPAFRKPTNVFSETLCLCGNSVLTVRTPVAALQFGDEGNQKDPRTSAIIGAAIEVHRHLGPGLLESAYEQCLCHELALRGLNFKCQVNVPVLYKGLHFDCAYKIDLIVNDEVIIELKSVERVLPVHEAQLMTYMKLVGKSVGLLINFNVPQLTRGIIRRVL
jgi:GxxExxY protein